MLSSHLRLGLLMFWFVTGFFNYLNSAKHTFKSNANSITQSTKPLQCKKINLSMYLTIKHHALNTYKGTPNGGEWVDSRLGRFTTVKRAPPPPPMKKLGGAQTRLGVTERRKICYPCRKRNPLLGRPAPTPEAITTRLSALHKTVLSVAAWSQMTELASRVCFLADRTPSGSFLSAAPLNWLAISNYTSMLRLSSQETWITARAKNKKFSQELAIILSNASINMVRLTETIS